jgi:hypothetical protein
MIPSILTPLELLIAQLKAAQDALVAIYEQAQNEWSGQCFCFTSAPESLRRAAHEAARDAFNAIVQTAGPIVRPIKNAEYELAAAVALVSPSIQKDEDVSTRTGELAEGPAPQHAATDGEG